MRDRRPPRYAPELRGAENAAARTRQWQGESASVQRAFRSSACVRWWGTGRHLITVVAPQVLRGAAPDPLLDRGIEMTRALLARQVIFHEGEIERIAAAIRQAFRGGHDDGCAGGFDEPPDQGHRKCGSPEKFRPRAFANSGHLIGQDADRFVAPESLEQSAHAAETDRCQVNAVAAAPDFDERLQALYLRRPVQHGDWPALCQPRGGNVETTEMRRQIDDPVAAPFCFLDER